MKKKTTPKKATKTAAPKKTAATKKVVKKAAKKVAPKPVAKKAVAKKAPVSKKAVKKAPNKSSAKTNTTEQDETSGSNEPMRPSQARILLARKNRAQTPAFVRVRTRKNTPIVFSLEEVHGILEKRKTETPKETEAQKAKKKALKQTSKDSGKKRVLGPASLTDILGFNPKNAKDRKSLDESRVPKKLLPYYRNLIQLRDHVLEGLDLHTKETLKRSAKEDAGDLSSYGQHMADAGTDTFDRDFALSMVSNEQDLLYEIEEAIQRIFDGSYGVCINTGKPIPHERLLAVPFTRYSLEGQREQERFRHKKVERGGIFGDLSGEETALYGEEGEED